MKSVNYKVRNNLKYTASNALNSVNIFDMHLNILNYEVYLTVSKNLTYKVHDAVGQSLNLIYSIVE